MSSTPSVDEIIAFATKEVKLQTKFCRTRFELKPRWKVHLTFGSKHILSRSSAGWDGEKIMMHLEVLKYSLPTTRHGHLEYKSYATDKVIGNIATDDWQIMIKGLVAHEMSHAVQHTMSDPKDTSIKVLVHNDAMFYDGLGQWGDGHTKFFKEIYSVLRKEFVNHLVPTAALGGKIKVVEHDPRALTHPLVGKEYMSAKRGRLILEQFLPRSRTFVFIGRDPLTGCRYKIKRENLEIQGLKV